jgi:tetratricopeptide (TPR) repeat protein
MRTLSHFLVLLLVATSVSGWVCAFSGGVCPDREAYCPNCDRAGRAADKEVIAAADAMVNRRYQEALSLYDSALRLGADEKFILGDKAYCHYELGQHEDAVAAADKLLTLDRDGHEPTGRARYVRGLVYKREGRTDKAREEFRLALMAKEPLAARQLRVLEKEGKP